MGLYHSSCSKCEKPFMWFSGNIHQMCGDCIDEMGGGVHTINQTFREPKGIHSGYFHVVGYNDAKTHDEAIDYLITKGIPADELS